MTATTARQWIPFLRRHLRAVHRLLPHPPTELSFALVGDARMSALHERFMGIAGPTDVLTFAGAGVGGDFVSGDFVSGELPG